MDIKAIAFNFLRHYHWFNWYRYKRLNREHEKEILAAYQKGEKTRDCHCQEIICLYGKHYDVGGLIDRLRGLVAAYEISIKNNIGFKIWWQEPFPLTRFLVPNKADWEIADQDICWSLTDTHVISAEITEESMHHEQCILNLINREIHNIPCKQLHLYTNMRMAYEDGSFTRLFNALFKTSPELDNAIARETRKIGGDYITVHCRFVGLLGDFKDVFDCVLPSSVQTKLVNRLIDKLEDIHRSYSKDTPMLICTDSPKFRDRVLEKLPYAYAVPGKIEHISYAASDSFMKTFLDLFLMSRAQHIYRLASIQMNLSGMPYVASLIGDKELSDIII